jgi:hypothetical protein
MADRVAINERNNPEPTGLEIKQWQFKLKNSAQF